MPTDHETRLALLDAAEDMLAIAERIRDLVDNGSGYSMSTDQMRIYVRSIQVVRCAQAIIDTVRSGR
ncbi:hypothetical protein [Schaalia hyovaginalis]|uniref:hypothetical protein n=1 Tax=Schaalia hyovaginalis TaxID=29316 RepID=UPI0026EAE4F0|nr:hypothetical protein [Schaalia hyovaginalis]MDD7554551.1 hypothetical protein [Schaalia hyovaginalis]MDY3093386.1 hypothetical protein [Schaalia hyovaginalis]